MAGKRVLLTLNPKLYEVLEEKAEKNYMTVQEFLSFLIRASLSRKFRKKLKKTEEME